MRRRALGTATAAAALVAWLAACATVVGIDGLEIGACKGGDCGEGGALPILEGGAEEDAGAEGDAADDSGELPCPGTGGPKAVRVGSSSARFCIDSTEVTIGQYKAFLAAKVPPASQPPECVWNTSFETTIGGEDDLPVVGVDWCDALAFCKWSGKYLCGKIENGKKVGPVPYEERGNPITNQWQAACSAEGRVRYPYGAVFSPETCNVGENDAGRALPVGAKTGCNGGYPGVFDMVGNVWEWYDGPCRSDAGLEVDGGDGGPASNECFVKGGSYVNRGTQFDCGATGAGARRDGRFTFVGFRCCSD